MIHNSTGSYRTTTAASMKAYDALPPTARRALSNAAFQWAPQPFLTAWRKGQFRTGEAIAQWVQEIDVSEVGVEAYKTYGPFHPQARKPVHRARARR
jgi:Family of unknown function (DUF6525)